MWSEQQLRHIADDRVTARMRAIGKEFASISSRVVQVCGGECSAGVGVIDGQVWRMCSM